VQLVQALRQAGPPVGGLADQRAELVAPRRPYRLGEQVRARVGVPAATGHEHVPGAQPVTHPEQHTQLPVMPERDVVALPQGAGQIVPEAGRHEPVGCRGRHLAGPGPRQFGQAAASVSRVAANTSRSRCTWRWNASRVAGSRHASAAHPAAVMAGKAQRWAVSGVRQAGQRPARRSQPRQPPGRLWLQCRQSLRGGRSKGTANRYTTTGANPPTPAPAAEHTTSNIPRTSPTVASARECKLALGQVGITRLTPRGCLRTSGFVAVAPAGQKTTSITLWGLWMARVRSDGVSGVPDGWAMIRGWTVRSWSHTRVCWQMRPARSGPGRAVPDGPQFPPGGLAVVEAAQGQVGQRVGVDQGGAAGRDRRGA
jgi:hypothetical protein